LRIVQVPVQRLSRSSCVGVEPRRDDIVERVHGFVEEFTGR